jgi:hypothetical protein
MSRGHGEFCRLNWILTNSRPPSLMRVESQIRVVFAHLPPPGWDTSRHSKKLTEWYWTDWDRLVLLFPLIVPRDQSGVPIDGKQLSKVASEEKSKPWIWEGFANSNHHSMRVKASRNGNQNITECEWNYHRMPIKASQNANETNTEWKWKHCWIVMKAWLNGNESITECKWKRCWMQLEMWVNRSEHIIESEQQCHWMEMKVSLNWNDNITEYEWKHHWISMKAFLNMKESITEWEFSLNSHHLIKIPSWFRHHPIIILSWFHQDSIIILSWF